MRCPCQYPSKHQHLGFVKIFLQLPGSKAGPKTCLSQCLIIIAVTQYTQTQKRGDLVVIAIFPYSTFPIPLSFSQLLGSLLLFVLDILFHPLSPQSGRLSKQLEKSHLALKGYFIPHYFCTIQNYCFQKQQILRSSYYVPNILPSTFHILFY